MKLYMLEVIKEKQGMFQDLSLINKGGGKLAKHFISSKTPSYPHKQFISRQLPTLPPIHPQHPQHIPSMGRERGRGGQDKTCLPYYWIPTIP